jgi:hypothetical protein
MSDTDDIIDLQIAVSDKAPELPNFGMPMLVDYHTAWLDYSREYAKADDMLDDGFTTSSPLYARAQALKSQSPAPPTFKIGRLATAYTQTVRLFPKVATTGFVYNFTINGTPITYTVPGSSTIATVCTALELLVEAVTGIESSATATYVEAVSTAGSFFEYVTARGLDVLDMTVDAGFAADIALIVDEDDDWYGLVPPPLDTYVASAAAWTEARVKTCFAQLSGYDVLDTGSTTDTGSDLVTQAYTRTAPIWHRDIGGSEYAADAFAAVVLGRDPGAATPAFKPLAGIGVDDLRAGDKTALKNKNVTRYARQGGANITFEGKTPSGRYIDVTRNVDFIDAQVRANIFAVFLNNPVVPYTDQGISLIKGAIDSALQTCVQMGILAANSTTVTVPKVAATAAADRAQRILRNIEFTGRLAGAIHRVVVRGTVSV